MFSSLFLHLLAVAFYADGTVYDDCWSQSVKDAAAYIKQHGIAAICPCTGLTLPGNDGECTVGKYAIHHYTLAAKQICQEQIHLLKTKAANETVMRQLATIIGYGLATLRASFNSNGPFRIGRLCVVGGRESQTTVDISILVEVLSGDQSATSVKAIIDQSLQSNGYRLGDSSVVVHGGVAVPNECRLKTHHCSEHAECIDTAESYHCHCKQNYEDVSNANMPEGTHCKAVVNCESGLKFMSTCWSTWAFILFLILLLLVLLFLIVCCCYFCRCHNQNELDNEKQTMTDELSMVNIDSLPKWAKVSAKTKGAPPAILHTTVAQNAPATVVESEVKHGYRQVSTQKLLSNIDAGMLDFEEEETVSARVRNSLPPMIVEAAETTPSPWMMATDNDVETLKSTEVDSPQNSSTISDFDRAAAIASPGLVYISPKKYQHSDNTNSSNTGLSQPKPPLHQPHHRPLHKTPIVSPVTRNRPPPSTLAVGGSGPTKAPITLFNPNPKRIIPLAPKVREAAPVPSQPKKIVRAVHPKLGVADGIKKPPSSWK